MGITPSDRFEHPLTGRYASDEMSHLFSPAFKFGTWRRLWLALAEAEKELGLPISDAQLNEMRAHLDDIDFDAAARHEKELRHDVMAHVHTFGDVAPLARPIIHLGATSAYVGDNTDLIQHRDALILVRDRLLGVIASLSEFAKKHRSLATLAFTHFQPAQPTTVGKRATLWIQDFLFDVKEIEFRITTLGYLGARGTTGTEASFLELFNGDHNKVNALNKMLCDKAGFDTLLGVSGQTYTRKIDAAALSTLSGVAQSASKMAHDLRLLQALKEIEEPFEAKQIGSSAMAYKRNPMRMERVTALARHAIVLSLDPSFTAATQWFERTLDDSANKRLSVPEAYLTVDAILLICQNVTSGLVVHPKVIERHLRDELPFMATENVLMRSVRAGGDRQELHERIRVHSMAAGRRIKEEGLDNDLFDRIAGDPAFGVTRKELDNEMDPLRFVGRAPEQVDEFLAHEVLPVLKRYPNASASLPDLKV